MMDIIWAAKQMRKGNDVRRKSWEDKRSFAAEHDGIAVFIYDKKEGCMGEFGLDIDDCLAKDWELKKD